MEGVAHAKEGESSGAGISTLMNRVNGRQSAYVNNLESRRGTRWEGRYKASPNRKEAYLVSCLRYSKENSKPVMAVAAI